MADYADLIERLEGLSGDEFHNKDLDAAIAVALGAEAGPVGRIGYKMRHVPWRKYSGRHWETLPDFTTSFDDAARLIDRNPIRGFYAIDFVQEALESLRRDDPYPNMPLKNQLALAVLVAYFRARALSTEPSHV